MSKKPAVVTKDSYLVVDDNGKQVRYTIGAASIALRDHIYQLNKPNPKLGPRQAAGPLNIGNYSSVYDEHTDEFTDRRRLEPMAAYTKQNLATHFGYYEEIDDYFSSAHDTVGAPPNRLVNGGNNQAKQDFDRQVIVPVRHQLKHAGVQGVKCWIYAVHTIDPRVNTHTGHVSFQQSDEMYLSVVPFDLNAADKKWGLDPQLALDLALAAGQIAFGTLVYNRIVMSVAQANEFFGSWQDGIPETIRPQIVKYFEEVFFTESQEQLRRPTRRKKRK